MFLLRLQAEKNLESLFVQKSNNHRGIKIQPLASLDLKTPGTFVQEYVRKPLLIGASPTPARCDWFD